MARYTGPVEKLERRLGVSLALKGERRLAGKSALEKRPYAPGQHGRLSNFSTGPVYLAIIISPNFL